MITLFLALAPVQGTLDDIWSRLKFDAEGRMRAEATIENVDPASGASVDDRYRGRMRFRIGAKYRMTEELNLAARLSTSSDGNDANNPHWDWGDGDGFSGGPLVFDRFFVDFMASPELHVVVGKQPHAFAVPPIFGDFLWDSDISPGGVTATWAPETGEGPSFDARVAAYIATESSAEQDPKMVGVQGNVRVPVDEAKLALSTAIYGWLDNRQVAVAGNQGNSATTEDFTIWESFASGTLPGGPMEEMSGYVQYMNNLESSDDGIAIGAQLGATRWKRGTYNAFLVLYTLDGDAVFSPVAQDDTAVAGTGLNDGDGDGTSGVVFGGTYWYRDNIAFKLWVLTSSPSGTDDDPIRVRFDMDFKVL